jgi:hypothetical protein
MSREEWESSSELDRPAILTQVALLADRLAAGPLPDQDSGEPGADNRLQM